MTILFGVHNCEMCGNMTRVVHASGGTMVCCGKPVTLRQEKTSAQGTENHVPVPEKSAKGIIMKSGSVPHPMEENHHTEWIEVRTSNNVYIRGLKPGEKPEAEFPVADTNVKVTAYCNMHVLWTTRP